MRYVLNEVEGVTSYTLPNKYLPLKKIVQNPAKTFGPGAFTIAPIVYVRDLESFLKLNPPDSAQFHAIMKHEQVHGKRQARLGLPVYVAKYRSNPNFMWAEEKLGWYAELTAAANAGLDLPASDIAHILTKYRTLDGRRMVSLAVAEAWVNDVLRGAWHPLT